VSKKNSHYLAQRLHSTKLNYQPVSPAPPVTNKTRYARAGVG